MRDHPYRRQGWVAAQSGGALYFTASMRFIKSV